MYVWKFTIPPGNRAPLPSAPDLAFESCLAVAVAETESDARACLIAHAAERGLDARWIAEPGYAKVARIDILGDRPQSIAWAML